MGRGPDPSCLPLTPQSLVQFLAQSSEKKTDSSRADLNDLSAALKAWNILRNEDRRITGRECEKAA